MDRDLVVARLLERGSTYREIAERLGVSIARVQQIIRTAQGLCTFCSRPAETKTLCARHAQRMRDRAARLREAEAGRTYSEIGAELGLTRERIRQIAAQAASGTNYSYVGVRYTAVGGRS